jgi:hypothetical protein
VQVCALTQLQRLSIDAALVSDAALGSLSALRLLRELHMKAVPAGVHALAAIGTLTQLNQLTLCSTDVAATADLAGLCGLSHLRSLSLGGTFFAPSSLSALQASGRAQCLGSIRCGMNAPHDMYPMWHGVPARHASSCEQNPGRAERPKRGLAWVGWLVP